jgi:hypothetical protein
MKKKIILLLLLTVSCLYAGYSQELVIKKGIVQDLVTVNDSIGESFAIYLPTGYDSSVNWPVLLPMDMKGRARQVLSMFMEAAEEQGYILAASNNIHDSLSITQNMLIVSRMINKVNSMFSINKERTYTAGFASGAKFAALVPSIIRPVEGVLSCGSAIPYMELLDQKKPFMFIGIVGRSDFNYTEMLNASINSVTLKKFVGKKVFDNYLITFDGGQEWPDKRYFKKGLEMFTLKAMKKGNVPKDSAYITHIYNKEYSEINDLISKNNMSGAVDLADEMLVKFKGLVNLDQLKNRQKALTKDKTYILQNRKERKYLQKEYFIRNEYGYNLNDDVLTLNYNNLGWWNYQMSEIKKYLASPEPLEREMGKRLLGFLNALIEDNLDLELYQNPVNEEALSFLWMVKTITSPKEYKNYLSIISDSAKHEDFGTALFYLEELLKNGYTNTTELYALEHTALFRITPEFNTIVDKYLQGARYDIIEE